MNNIIRYAAEVLDTFDTRPFSDVDSLILSCAAYIHLPGALPAVRDWDGLRLAELYRAEHFAAMFSGTFAPEDLRALFCALAASPRFRDLRVCGFREVLDPAQEKQFSAVTFCLGRDWTYVAFRGTDSTLVGWKEDFNMTFQTPIPSQTEAVRYLGQAARHCPGVLRLGGHSKGGNLAVYAAAFCRPEVQKRIISVYSHDGPGFLETVLRHPGFSRIHDRVEKTLPQSSVVGLLLEQQETGKIIRSSGVGVSQHDPFTWELENGAFVVLEHLTPEARYLDRALTAWLQQVDPAQRERLVDVLFQVLGAGDIQRFSDLRTDWQKAVPAVVHAASHLDPETREFLFQTLKELASLSLKALPESLLEKDN